MFFLHVIGSRIVHEFGVSEERFRPPFLVALPNRLESEYFEFRKVFVSSEHSDEFRIVPVLNGVFQGRDKSVSVRGIDFFSLNLADLLAGSSPLETQTEGFLSEDSLISFSTDWQVGDKVGAATVVAQSTNLDAVLVGDIATVQSLLDRREAIDYVWLVPTRSIASSIWVEIEPGLATFGQTTPTPHFPGYSVVPVSNPTQGFSSAIAFNLAILSLLASVVAAFIVYQLMRTSIVNRAALHTRFDALGMEPFMPKVTFGGVYIALGVIASMFALGIGELLIDAFVASATEQAKDAEWIGFAKGALLTLLLTAIVSFGAQRKSVPKPTVAIYVICGAVSSMSLLLCLFLFEGLIAAFAAIVAVCALVIFCVLPLAIAGVHRLARGITFGNHLTRATVRSLGSSLSETQVAAAALVLALANAISIALLVSSFRVNFDEMLDMQLPEGVYVQGNTQLSKADCEELVQANGLCRSYYRGTLNTDRGSMTATLAELDAFELAQYGDDLAPSTDLLVNEQAHFKYGLEVGDSLTIYANTGVATPLTVGHIYRDYGAPSPSFIVDSRFASEFRLDDHRLTAYSRNGNTADLLSKFEVAQPSEIFLTHNDIKSTALAIFENTFRLTQLMPLIALILAVIGLASAFRLLLDKRRTEFRVLHTIGVSRLQLSGSSLAQVSAISTVVVVCAVPLSLLVAWLLCNKVNPAAFGWTIDLQLSTSAFVLPLFLIAISTLVTGLDFGWSQNKWYSSRPIEHAS